MTHRSAPDRGRFTARIERKKRQMSDDLGIAGKTALVTGSGRNIGRAIVLELARHGANVIINAHRNEAETSAVAREAERLGVRSLVVMGDASESATVDQIRARAEEAFGGVDIYVSNAARRLHKDFFETTNQDWHYHLNQQLTACWYLARAFVPGMRDRGWGRVVHISGAGGWLGNPMAIPHSTGEGGLLALTKSLAKGLGQYSITVNKISPGVMATTRDPETHPQLTRERTEEIARTIPIGRQPTPEELAWACAFLCSTRSAAITGAVI
jgi:3-oxoacyl-[acyl-carrier protein] reductase